MNENGKSYFIGTHLRQARDQRGWSQEVFATMVGMSQPNLSNIESGKQKVPWETITLMAQQLGLNPESLAGLEVPVIVHVETQNGGVNGTANHLPRSGEVAALQAHIASLQEENRFLRPQVQER